MFVAFIIVVISIGLVWLPLGQFPPSQAVIIIVVNNGQQAITGEEYSVRFRQQQVTLHDVIN